MKGVTVITPTGDRPLAFGLLRDYWMPRQTIHPDQWIIIDDGKEPYDTKGLPYYAEYMRRIATTDSHSIGYNLQIGLSFAKYDDVIIMEDDDWYSPHYIAYMTGLLQRGNLVGLWGTNYYHVKVPGYREMGRSTHASLSQTAFKSSFIPQVEKELAGDIQIDLRIWRHNKGFLVAGRDRRMQCSMKGMPGRANAGIGKIEKHYTKDPGYRVLRQWCGDAEIYIDLMERGIV